MPSNDLIARYLQAIGFWLPRATKQDILAEISEDLHSQIEDREASLNRPLTDAEIEELLKQRGHPVTVASGYLPQQSLIGPVLFPTYKFVLKIVSFCYFVPWLIFWIVFLFSTPHHLHVPTTAALIRSLSTWLFSVTNTLVIVTLIFYAIERGWLGTRYTGDWDPRKLPKVHLAKPRRRSEDIATIVFGFLYLLWLLVVPDFPILVIGPAAFFVKAAPVWHSIYPLILLLAILGIVEPVVGLLRNLPAWERPVFKFVTNCIALWVAAILLHTPTYFVAQGQQAQQYTVITNLVVYICVTGVSVGLTIALVVELVTLIRMLFRREKSAVPRTA
jgi:hypothetical protein